MNEWEKSITVYQDSKHVSLTLLTAIVNGKIRHLADKFVRDIIGILLKYICHVKFLAHLPENIHNTQVMIQILARFIQFRGKRGYDFKIQDSFASELLSYSDRLITGNVQLHHANKVDAS